MKTINFWVLDFLYTYKCKSKKELYLIKQAMDCAVGVSVGDDFNMRVYSYFIQKLRYERSGFIDFLSDNGIHERLLNAYTWKK